METKAKFKCTTITTNPNVNSDKTVDFEAVIGNDGENADYAKYTPHGVLRLSVSPETRAFDFFEEGQEYYLVITKAA